MARYSIADTTLTALGDAVRSKVGETEIRHFELEAVRHTMDHTNNSVSNAYIIQIPTGATKAVITKVESIPNAVSLSPVYASFVGNLSVEYLSDENPTIELYKFTKTEFRLQSLNMNTEGYYCTFDLTFYDDNDNIVITPIDMEVPKTMTPERMTTEINNLEALNSDLLHLTGSLSYRFYNGYWDKFLTYYGDKITTENISEMGYAFRNVGVSKIPFEINCGTYETGMNFMCEGSANLTEPPIIYNAKPTNMNKIFSGCKNIREFPEDYAQDWDWSKGIASTLSNKSAMFTTCYSLRKLPMILFQYCNPTISYSNHPLREMNGLFALDEIVNMPYPYTIECKNTGYSGLFYNSFTNMFRIKNLTFASDIGTKKWAKQALELNTYFGWVNAVNDIIKYNSGITLDKRVEDDATYQALKNDPDWFTTDVAYSRYNHDSAVATINSLPDCSEYAATNGANTIKFKGAAGEKTDGGAINTLTDEEIAVAAAKGWTVTLV